MAMKFGHEYSLYPTPLLEFFSWAKIRARLRFGHGEGRDGGITGNNEWELMGSDNPMVDPPFVSMEEFCVL